MPHEAFTEFELTRSHLVLAGATAALTLCGRRALAFGKDLQGERSQWAQPVSRWCERCLARYTQAEDA